MQGIQQPFIPSLPLHCPNAANNTDGKGIHFPRFLHIIHGGIRQEPWPQTSNKSIKIKEDRIKGALL